VRAARRQQSSEPPPGLALRTFEPADAERFHAALEDAFADHWVNDLGVRAPWRRRGLGELLLRTAFAEFARRGETRVGLGVDGENEAGATRLYERVGIRVAFRVNVFRKDLR
jgi:ribosomal protein S18 acetylase RimI-like enzyme